MLKLDGEVLLDFKCHRDWVMVGILEVMVPNFEVIDLNIF